MIEDLGASRFNIIFQVQEVLIDVEKLVIKTPGSSETQIVSASTLDLGPP